MVAGGRGIVKQKVLCQSQVSRIRGNCIFIWSWSQVVLVQVRRDRGNWDGGNVQIVVTHNEQDFCKVIKLLVLLTTSCDDFKVSLTEEENFDDPSRAKSSEFDL